MNETPVFEPLRVERARNDLRDHMFFVGIGVILILAGIPISIFADMPFVVWMMTGGGWGALYIFIAAAFAWDDVRVIRAWKRRGNPLRKDLDRPL